MSDMDCPKCRGPRDAKALYCPFCGVIFARYSGEGAAPAPIPAARPAVAPAASSTAPAEPAKAPAMPAQTLYGGALSAEQEAAWNPYESPRSAPLAGQRSAAGSYELASPSSRLSAQMLNGLGFLGVTLLCALPGIVLQVALPPDNPAGLLCLVFGSAIGMGMWLISNLRQLGKTGQSLGKKWMDIRILKTNGEQASVTHLVFMRYLSMKAMGAVPYAGLVVELVDALMIFTAERRCLHDHIAGTMVVKA